MALGTVASRIQQSKSDSLGKFSSTDDTTMIRQILGTHAPDGREVDVKPLLNIIKDILHRAALILPGIVKATQAQPDAIEDKSIQSSFTDMHDHLAYTISKISCEIACKCSGGGDAHATTLGLFKTLSCYSWDAKVVIVLAAFAVNYGEFWLVAQLYPSNPLAKSVAILKQLPDMQERADTLKPKFEALTNLIMAMMDVTECIVAFKELPSQYITPDTPEIDATAHIPTAAYWTIQSIVACASQIMGLIGMGHDDVATTTEAGELSRLADEVNNTYSHLNICYQNCKKHIEAYQTLVRLFDTPQIDNLKILKALIYAKEDQLPIFDAFSKRRVRIDSLRGKKVLLYISDLGSHEELSILKQMYQESQQQTTTVERDYEVVWLPVVDRSTPLNEKQFVTLQGMMPWYSVSHPSLLDPAVIRYIKEVWKFNKKPLLVVLDPKGKVVNPNAIPMMWIWGKSAFPFRIPEDALWKEEGKWSIEVLAGKFYPELVNWISEGKYICFYGGEDLEWIRKFTITLQNVSRAAEIPLEMLYVGKRNPKVKVELKNVKILDEEQMRIFWVRLESLWHYKVQHGKSVENDQIMKEITTILSFDGTNQGWAVISRGSAGMAKAKGETILKCLDEYEINWKKLVQQKGFMDALNDHLNKLHTPHHCNHLIMPWTTGIIPEKVNCPDCNQPMEKIITYRCCTD